MRCLSLLVLIASTYLSHAQYLGFITRVGQEVDAPVSYPDGAPPGPGFHAQLFRILDDGTLLGLEPTTTFQTGAAEPRNRFYVEREILLVPDIHFPDLFADPIEIKVKMRVWEGANWQTSLWRGESEEISVLIHNLLFPPANLVGLKGFLVERQPRISASQITPDGQVQLGISSNIADLQTVVVERSTDLINWTEFGEFFVSSDQAIFNDPAIQEPGAGFFRVKFQ
jgi:hypothetical protein